MDPFWYDSPKILFLSSRLKEFWPNREMSMDEKLNAATRFIIYSTSLIAIYRNDPTVFIAGLCLCALIAVIVRFKLLKTKRPPLQPSHSHPKAENMTSKPCTKPSRHNPFGNVTMADYTADANRPADFEAALQR